MPLLCPHGFDTCTTRLADRERYRKNNTDVCTFHEYTYRASCRLRASQEASPGYFSQILDNDIQMEATSTRRAGLERFTFPSGSKPYFVLDLANDLPESFAGGTMDIDPDLGRITIGGHWGSRWEPKSILLEFLCLRCSLIVSDLGTSIIKPSRALICSMEEIRS